MVYLYAANISNLPDPKEHPEILEGLWKERKEKALQYINCLKESKENTKGKKNTKTKKKVK